MYPTYKNDIKLIIIFKKDLYIKILLKNKAKENRKF